MSATKLVRIKSGENVFRVRSPMTVSEAARKNGVSRRTIQRWVKQGTVAKLPDGKVDGVLVKVWVETFQDMPRRGPVPGRFQLKLRLGKTRTGRQMSDFQRMDIVFRHLNAIDNPVLLGFVADKVRKLFSERMGQVTKGLGAMKEFIKNNPPPGAPTSSAGTSSSVDSAGGRASVPPQ